MTEEDHSVGEIKIGDLIPMKSFTTDNGFVQLSFKKQKGDKRYLFVLLGAATPEQLREKPDLALTLMGRLGWQPIPLPPAAQDGEDGT